MVLEVWLVPEWLVLPSSFFVRGFLLQESTETATAH